MVLDRPKQLVAVLNGFEIGVESPNTEQDALEFQQFCTALQSELAKLVTKPEVVN